MAEYLASEDLIDDEPSLAAERLARGTRLGRYELLLPIAKGGMARVWAARQHGQRGFTKVVAIKTILPHLARDGEFERMFLDEARIASMVHHPNVCEIYELGEEGKVLYLAMEWVNGESLAHILRVSGTCQPLEPRIVARIVSETCAGLNAAHNLEADDGTRLGVVHRDVSPHNILVSADGHVKVADFGVAKALGQSHSSTSAGQLKGKIDYMAPEQVTGGAIDRRSDLFSLGCVLYEATTGIQPFKGEGDHQVMHRLLKGDLVPPSQVVRGYPPELERIVIRALAPQPIGRFPTADRMRMALEEWLAKGPVVTETHVAGAVKARVGTILERRRERIRAAQSSAERVEVGGEMPIVDGLTPSGPTGAGGLGGSGSGVVPMGAAPISRRPERRASSPAISSTPMPDPPSPRSGRMGSTLPLGTVPPPVPERPTPTAPAPPPGNPEWNEMTSKYQPVLEAQIADSVASGRSAPSLPSIDEGTGSGSHSRSAPIAVPVRAAAEPMHYAIGAVLALVVVGALAAIGFFLSRARHPSAPPTPPAVVVPAPAQPAAAAPPAVDTSITVEAVEPIMFFVTPDAAVLIVDGVEQAAGVRAVPRKPGQSVVVIVRAPEYEDATVLIDDGFTNKTVAVALTPVAKKHRTGDGKRVDPLPANPY